MKDFIFAALPFVAIGIALAVAVVAFAQNKKATTQKSEDTDGDKNYLSEGMSLGTCLGVAVGCIVNELAVCLSIGMLFGITVGMCIKKK